jgi:hypothetical protein
MGLTIHYRLKLARADAGVDDLQARDAVAEARKLALRFKRQGRVDAVGKIGFTPDLRGLANDWRTRRVRGQPNTFSGEEIRPVAGQLFLVEVGRDCEPLLLELCRYPQGGWRLTSFSKTQYASLHGWEHFQRCHGAVIELLAALRPLGFRVKITDEGEYWPRRSWSGLRQNLDEMNGVVAAAAGALKDMGDASGGSPVESPIFAHPHFERLEAEGAAQGHAERLRKALR